MIKRIISYSACSVFFILAVTLKANAQCTSCTSSAGPEPTCDTDNVNMDAYSSCTCLQGCDCVGDCDYHGDHLPSEAFYNIDINWNEINIPEKGMRIFIPGNQDFIEQENLKVAYLGSKKAGDLFIGKHFGAYKITNNMFILYPLNSNNSFKVKNCSNKLLGVASLLPKSFAANISRPE